MEVPAVARVPPPTWINRDFIESVLKKTERKKIIVDSIDVQYANAEGAGYTSLMFRLTAFLKYEENEELQKKTLIVKTILESGEMKDLIEKLDVFKIEAEMLHDVMPQLHEQLAALEGDEFRPLAAKCYQWGQQPATYLVLEDLSATGFGLAQADQPLDLEHCAVTLRAFARLHAASAYLLSQQPHYKDKFCLNVFTDKITQQNVETTGKKFMAALANEFDKCPGYEHYSERYRAYADRFLDITSKRMEEVRMKTKLPVITHSDCWKNNMMFKYLNGAVSQVRIIDYQLSSVSSPASDLVYFLYANASEEVHRHHMEDLLREYHGSLVGVLRRLGMEREAEAYTFEELNKDMDHCLGMGLYYSTMSGMILTSEKYGAEYVKAFNDPNNSDEAAVMSFRNPYSLPYLKYLTPIFVRKGIL